MSDPELTTGFGSWLGRQPERSEAGKLAALLREDLSRGRIGSWPRTRREVREWAERLHPMPTQLPVWLARATREWRVWLDTLTEEASAGPPSSGHPIDNPFSRRTLEAAK